jgi:hypothetical protein
MPNSAIITLATIVLLVSCTVATALNIMPANAQSRCDWVEYSNNPVFGQWLGGAKAYYPKVLYDLNQFSGHGDSAYYKMWFGSENGTGGNYCIGYTHSDNGINWTGVINPVSGLAPRSGHPLVKYFPGGFGSGYFYRMWYWDEGASINFINVLRYAESTDGVNWVNDQPLTQDGGYPLVTNNPGFDWNAGSYGSSDLIYNPSGSLDDVNLWNNKYVMYYMGTNNTNEFIGLAYSDNGTHWKRFGDDPVLSPCTLADDPSAGWDYLSVGYCSVINLSGNWHMWYGGGPNTKYGIGYATSPDGISWTKHSDNPIFHKDDGISWRNQRTYTPWVVYDAASFSGHGDAYNYKMWFNGTSISGKYSVGYAYVLPLTVDAGPDRTISSGGSTLIGGSPTTYGGKPPYNYSWNPTAGLDDSTLANPAASPTGTTTYTVTVTDNKSCTGSDSMTVYVQTPSPSTGGGGSLPASFVTCPATLAADMQGNIATVRMTKDGVLCKACLAKDAADKDTLELDKDTRVMLADNTVPALLRLSEASVTPPAPENTTIVGPVYELNAYSSTLATTPSPITISPAAKLLLTYNQNELPENTSEVFIATYDTEKGWLPLDPVAGTVAEIGKAHGLVSHFTLFAVLAKLSPPEPAKFEVGNLTISPSQAQLNQEVTVSVNVANTGGKSGDYSLELKVDGTVTSTQRVTAAAGASQTVNFVVTGDAAGKHQVEIAGLVGEFDVTKTKTVEPSKNNWWLIGGTTAVILLIIVVLIVLTR